MRLLMVSKALMNFLFSRTKWRNSKMFLFLTLSFLIGFSKALDSDNKSYDKNLHPHIILNLYLTFYYLRYVFIFSNDLSSYAYIVLR